MIGEYWEAAAVTFLFTLGTWLEARTVRHTRGALRRLLRAAPTVAHVLRGAEVTEVPAHEVEVDEIVLVKPGQKIPVDGEAIGVLALADRPRPAAAVAVEIGIEEVHAGLLPEEKLGHNRRLQAVGRRVGMLGDEINDAPALAAADTSIAMGAAGSDLAIETPDIALLSDDLEKLPRAISISRATTRNMRQNLGIALVTVSGLLTAVLTGHVHMAGGMLIHQLSGLAVVDNAARLLRRPRSNRKRIPNRFCTNRHNDYIGDAVCTT